MNLLDTYPTPQLFLCTSPRPTKAPNSVTKHYQLIIDRIILPSPGLFFTLPIPPFGINPGKLLFSEIFEIADGPNATVS